MSKILAIDWGEKIIGTAISDELKIIAKPFKAIKNDSFACLKKIISEENIEKVIVGRPRNINGSLGDQATKVDNFYKQLQKKINTPLFYEDETNTTNIAKSLLLREGINPQREREMVNNKAAQLILQGYLDETNK